MIGMADEHWQRPGITVHSQLLSNSFRHWTGRSLLDIPVEGEALTQALYRAPFVLVSHGTESDPLFNYANLTAQSLWGLAWNEFVGMPSRRSAEVEAQTDRTAALRTALSKGWVEGYTGIRIAADGRRFWIYDGIIWNLRDRDGSLRGQAATFSRWTFIGDNS